MGSMFKSPKAPVALPVAEMPTEADQETARRMRARKALATAMTQGRESTMVSASDKLGG